MYPIPPQKAKTCRKPWQWKLNRVPRTRQLNSVRQMLHLIYLILHWINLFPLIIFPGGTSATGSEDAYAEVGDFTPVPGQKRNTLTRSKNKKDKKGGCKQQ